MSGASYLFIAVYLMLIMGISAVVYVLNGLAFHRMGKTCGVAYPWLAWVPVANMYAMGQIADKDAELNGRAPTHYRRILLIMSIIGTIAGWILGVVMIYQSYLIVGSVDGELVPDAELSALIFGLVMVWLAFLVYAVVMAVFEYIAMWHIFKLFTPDNAVVFLLLSIFISAANPILMFLASRKTPPVMSAATETFPTDTPPTDADAGGSFYIQ